VIATIATIAASAVVAAVLTAGALAYRKVRQRRTARMLRVDTPTAIIEERFIRVGGIEQWISIRGEDRANPVLLVLHGGPGQTYSIFTPLLRAWEKHFTVVQWDRRGVGKTLGRNGKAGSGEMSFARMVDDGIEVTEFLRAHLHKDTVILMGGSMGNIVGLPLVQRRPDLFSCYVGTDLAANMAQAQSLCYQLTMERLRRAGNTKGIAELERIGADPTRWDVPAFTRTQMKWAMKSDPVTPNLVRKMIVPMMLTSPSHSLGDVGHIGTGLGFSATQLFEQFMAYDARQLGTRFQVPFFLLQGDTDVLTPTSLAEEYFAEINAPIKTMALIKDAGHLAAFTQPEQFLTQLLLAVSPPATAPDPA
jgi:pimeloyl-ACP methyl ester carboxylesterase